MFVFVKMNIKKGEWLLILFNFIYVISFLIYYIKIENYEFLSYIFIMLVLFSVIALTLKKTGFNYFVLWGLSIWGLLHMAGGSLKVGNEVLYAFRIIPIWVTENFYVLRFDQFVHFYLYFVMVFVIWGLLKKELKVEGWNKFVVYALICLGSLGIGGLNEVIEFIMVLVLAETGVGGYYNTAWDIVFNTLGALLGVLVLMFVNRKR